MTTTSVCCWLPGASLSCCWEANAKARRRLRLRCRCTKTSDGGDEDDASRRLRSLLGLAPEEIIAPLLQSEESRGMLRELEAAALRVQQARRELRMIDEQAGDSRSEQASGKDLLRVQQSQIDACEEELEAAKAEAQQAQEELVQAAALYAKDNSAANPRFDEQGERLESVKAAVMSACSGTLASLPFVFTQPGFFELDTLLNAGLVFITSALYGVSYRYILREDLSRVQLKAGSAAAFALARGLGQVQLILSLPDYLTEGVEGMVSGSVAYVAQSLLIFLCASLALDLCYQKGLLRPSPRSWK